MQITRRQFLKYSATLAAMLGLTKFDLFKLEKALAATGAPAVIWLQAGGCTGCSVSLLNRIAEEADPVTDVAELLLERIDLRYHPNIMAAAGDLAVAAATNTLELNPGAYVLVVEGAVSTGADGRYCYVWEDEHGNPVTAYEAVREFAANALGTIAIGCAAFAGIPGAHPNPTGCQPLEAVVSDVVSDSQRPINLPGCPIHPDWLVETVVRILLGPEKGPSGRLRAGIRVDNLGRPSGLYKEQVHENCPRRYWKKAQTLGVEGCLRRLGCEGRNTTANCPIHLWNNRQKWCIGANGPCIGCTQTDFPDACVPFYTLDKWAQEEKEEARLDETLDVAETKLERSVV